MFGITVSPFEWISLALLALCAWIFPGLGERFFRRCQRAFASVAQRKQWAIVIAGLTPILLRLALLPALPVPAPTIHDEFSYLLAADTFAHGRLANPPHPMWLSFETFHVNMHPTYGSKYPPAQGIALALGEGLGHPWLGVLLSVGAMCAAICWMLQAWFPPDWAFLGALLAAIRFGSFSYWINSYWGGAVAGIGGALALGALPLMRKTQRVRYAIILGIGVAILANSRPFEGLIFTIPIVMWLTYWLLRKDEVPLQTKIWHTVLPLAVVLALAGGWIGYYNWRATGNPAIFPYVLNDRTYETEPSFIWQSARPKHAYNNAQLDLFYNTWTRSQYQRSWADLERVTISKLQTFWDTFLGPVCVLPAFMLPWVLGDRRSRLFVVTFVFSWLALLSVVWWQGLGHYAAPLTGLTFGLIVQAMRHLKHLRFEDRPVGLAWLRVSVLMLFVAFGASLVRQVHRPYSWTFGFGPGNLQRASILKNLRSQPGKHLVMVRYGHPHNVHNEWIYNDADIASAKVVWARELNSDQDEKVLSYFSDRHVWLVEPDKAPDELKPYTAPTLVTSANTP